MAENSFGVMQSDANTAPSIGDGGWNVIGTVGAAAINTWSAYSLGQIQRQMTQDVINYNNSMRAIVQGVKQYTADRNRAVAGDNFTDEQIRIEMDRLRAESQATVGAAFVGASSSARKATMFSIDRNAAQAKYMNETKFESTLQQIQLHEFSDNIANAQAYQNPGNVQAPSLGAGVTSTLLSLGDKSIKSGAWEKGASARTFFSDLFKNTEARLPTNDKE